VVVSTWLVHAVDKVGSNELVYLAERRRVGRAASSKRSLNLSIKSRRRHVMYGLIVRVHTERGESGYSRCCIKIDEVF